MDTLFLKSKTKQASIKERQDTPAGISIFVKLLFSFLFFGIFPLFINTLFLIVGYESVSLDLVNSLKDHISFEESRQFGENLRNLRIQAAAIALIFFTLIFLGSVVLGRILTGPIKRFIYAMTEVSKGNLSISIPITSQDEIGQLTTSFNEMVTKLREIHEREEAVSRNKSEFISIAAHQLRTPTSAVKWALRIVLDGDLGKVNAKQAEILERGYLANERMIRLIGDLLNVSRIEEGRFGYSFEYIDILSVVNKTLGELMAVADSRGLSLKLYPTQEQLPNIYADPNRIGLVLYNLIDNAINYTSAPGSIIVKIRKVENALEISIRDDGVGIPKEEMHNLFAKFFRGANVIRLQTDGSGLGLFITKNIINHHGGKIWIKSEEGKGTTVFFTLPTDKNKIPQKQKPFEKFIGSI